MTTIIDFVIVCLQLIADALHLAYLASGETITRTLDEATVLVKLLLQSYAQSGLPPTSSLWTFYVIAAIAAYVAVPPLSRLVWYLSAAQVKLFALETRTWLLWRTNRATDMSRVDRPLFARIPLGKLQLPPGHSHPMSAAVRTLGNKFMRTFAARLGRTQHVHNLSRPEQRRGQQGYRSWTHDKHVTITPSFAMPSPEDVVTMTDTDYFMDMPSWLADNVRTTVINTFCPADAAGVREEYSFTFGPDNMLTYRVRHGFTAVHPVWNYSADELLVTKRMCGIPYRAVTYLVDRRATDEDHQLVLLTPTGEWNGLWAWLASGVKHTPLRTIDGATGKHVRLDIMCPKRGHVVSTSLAGEYTAATLDVEHDEAIARHLRNAKSVVTSATIESFLGPTSQDAAALIARKCKGLILHEFHSIGAPHRAYVSLPEDRVDTFDFGKPSLDPPKVALVPFMNPIYPGSAVPVKSKGNDARGVSHRVTRLTNRTEASPFVLQTIEEFVAFCVPVRHQGEPTTAEEVLERQTTPAQQNILQFALASFRWIAKRVAKSFQKAEAYSKIADPRLITTIAPHDKLEYSAYCYTAAAHLKTMPWYAFGKATLEVAQRVADVCMHASSVVESDYSRFDGTMGQPQRILEESFMRALFATPYHEQLADLMGSQHHLNATTSLGVRYQTAYSRLSGSPETSIMNTLVNAYTCYLAARMSGSSPSASWDRVHGSVFGGDDGLIGDVGAQHLVKACAATGLSIKADTTPTGAPCVHFLARTYGPDVWYGAVSSMCDLPRQLGKLHLTKPLTGIAATDKLVEKCRGYAQSDGFTPVIGPFVNKVVLLARGLPDSDHGLTPHHVVNGAYPNTYGTWMDDQASLTLPDCDWTAFLAAVEQATTLAELLEVPSIRGPVRLETEETVIVSGEQRHAPPKPPASKRKARGLERAARHREAKAALEAQTTAPPAPVPPPAAAPPPTAATVPRRPKRRAARKDSRPGRKPPAGAAS